MCIALYYIKALCIVSANSPVNWYYYCYYYYYYCIAMLILVVCLLHLLMLFTIVSF